MIKTKNLNHIYQPGSPFEKQAIIDINININKGEFVGIIGHTGSGKSTLIQHFNALEIPTSGKVIVDGVDVTAKGADLKKVRRSVGLVFQYPEHQLMEETVYKDIAFGPKNIGFSEEEIKERVYESISLVGIKEKHLKKSPFELSGGEKRRVAIAGVIAMNPKVLILDEPTAGLDPYGRDDILEKIKSMHKDLNMTVVLVSHTMEEIARLAQRIIVLNEGKVSMDAPTTEVFSRADELREMGLDVPQISIIISELIKRGWDLPQNIFSVNEALEQVIKFLEKAKN